MGRPLLLERPSTTERHLSSRSNTSVDDNGSSSVVIISCSSSSSRGSRDDKVHSRRRVLTLLSSSHWTLIWMAVTLTLMALAVISIVSPSPSSSSLLPPILMVDAFATHKTASVGPPSTYRFPYPYRLGRPIIYEREASTSASSSSSSSLTSIVTKTSTSSTVLSTTATTNDDMDGTLNPDTTTIAATTITNISSPTPPTGYQRFLAALPFKNDSLDKLILQTAIPSILNLAVVPLVNSVDTFWVGRLGIALALAGQAAANQACFTVWFLIAFVPNITAPLVAKAVSSDDPQTAQEKVCESIFLCNVLGTVGTLALICFPKQILSALLLPQGAPAMDYAAPYLRWRALGMVPSLIGATGSAAYRGMLDTLTPLKVSLMTNTFNLLLDPILIFGTSYRFVGAAIATAAAESLGGATYIYLLLKKKLARWSLLMRPPSFRALIPLLQGGAAMLLRQLALNVGFLVATRQAQQLDPTGVSGAAYGITMQIYSVGIICLVGMQGCAAALVPSYTARSGTDGARACADRLLSWSTLVGSMLGAAQFLLLPVLVPLFSTLPSVQEAVKVPSLIASLIHVVNGPILAAEGILIGLGRYRTLASITMSYMMTVVACLTLTPLGKRLDGIMWSILIASVVEQFIILVHYLKVGPLAVKKQKQKDETTATSTDEIVLSDGATPSPTSVDGDEVDAMSSSISSGVDTSIAMVVLDDMGGVGGSDGGAIDFSMPLFPPVGEDGFIL